MNSVIEQCMRCVIYESGNINDWQKILFTVELFINSLPDKSTVFSPFYLNYGHEPLLPIQLLRGSEEIQTESVGSFVRRVISDWKIAKKNSQKAVSLQQKYYNRKHQNVQYAIGDLVLLSTRNLKMKGIPDKIKKRFMGPFKIQARIGEQAYRFLLPDTWKVHPVFHISLLKKWNAIDLQEEEEFPIEELEIEEPYYEIEKLLRWKKVKRNRQLKKEYSVLWKVYPIEEAQWVPAENFMKPTDLQKYIHEDEPQEEKV